MTTPQVFSNDWIRQGLQRREMIEPLEHLLSKEIERYKALKKLKDEGKLDFGPVLSTQSELEGAFDLVVPEVDGFLDFESDNLPNIHIIHNKPLSTIIKVSVVETVIGALLFSPPLFMAEHLGISPYYALCMTPLVIPPLLMGLIITLPRDGDYYDNVDCSIVAKIKERVYKIVDLAHEYTHYADNITKKYTDEEKITMRAAGEGLAFGVEKHIANHFYEREGNPAFLYSPLRCLVESLMIVYKWFCRKNKITLKENLLNVSCKAPVTSDILIGFDYRSIGYVACALEEMAQGNGIYKQMLQGTFQPVLVVPN